MKKLSIGDKVSLFKSFTEQDVFLFSELSLDKNPIHLDEDYAKTSVFKKRIVHGMLVSSLFSGLIANQLPGKGSIYLNQELNFKHPIFFDEEVKVEVEIIHIREDKPIFTLKTICQNSVGKIAIEGKAVVMLKS